METVSVSPPVADAAAWAEARERVQGYLRAHGVPATSLGELSEQVLQFARERHAAQPDLPPVELAADAAILLIEGWIQHIVGLNENEGPGRRLAHERAAVHLAAIPQRWSQHFLNEQDPPPELVAELRKTYVQAGPDLEFSNMMPRPIDLGPVSDMADTTWRTFDKWPFLRGVATWALYVGALALAFYAVRY
ncbi:MAG: hypothetical protein C0518_04865 [Opitutus sp.]|nr:hypothetical protein [Opitutus sp.]